MRPVNLGRQIGVLAGGWQKWVDRSLRAIELASYELDPRYAAPIHALILDVGDETTAITAAADKKKFRMPYAMELTTVPRASLSTAQASGNIFTVDIHDDGTTILSTKITIDNTEKTSTTAAAPAVLAVERTILLEDSEITIDVDQIGNGSAAGLKVCLIGRRYPS